MDLDRLKKLFSGLPSFNLHPEFGILTSADGGDFESARLLIMSARKLAPFAIIDLGIKHTHKVWCVNNHVQVLTPNLRVGIAVPMWKEWNIPFFISDCPFSKTVWLDNKCVIVGDLSNFTRAMVDGMCVGNGRFINASSLAIATNKSNSVFNEYMSRCLNYNLGRSAVSSKYGDDALNIAIDNGGLDSVADVITYVDELQCNYFDWFNPLPNEVIHYYTREIQWNT